MIQPVLIFLFSLAFNAAVKLATPFLGKFRSGMDAMLFCAIVAGFVGGVRSGFVYGLLIAVTFYVIRSKHWDYAAFVIPMTMLMGMTAGFLNTMPLHALALLILFIYHSISLLVFGLIFRSIGPGYMVFIILNVLTTYGLVLLVRPFL